MTARLADFARLAVELGVNLQAGQELVVSAPLEAADFVRHLARAAYARGASGLTCLYEDPMLLRARLEEAGDVALDSASCWLERGMAAAQEEGAARLRILAPRPELLDGIAPRRILHLHRAIAKASRRAAPSIDMGRLNECTVPFVTESWAQLVFPESAAGQAVASLWQTILVAARMDEKNPAAAWRTALDIQRTRRDHLRAAAFLALHFYDGDTDLTLGLPPSHVWQGGERLSGDRMLRLESLPCETLWTAAQPRQAWGRVVINRPIAIAGGVVEGLVLCFRGGGAADISATKGGEALSSLLASQAALLQPVKIGLVAQSAPLARTGLMYFNPLLDTNAATHLTVAQLPSGSEAGEASGLRFDAAFGSESMNVDGIDGSGHARPVMRNGEFVS